MGIKGLSKLIQTQGDGSCIKENEIKSYFGRKVAIDASMALYQFLIAVRMQSENGSGNYQQLMNDEGQVTSHLIGILYRTIRMCENGIKPLYVFDGKPPDFKSHELEKRKEKREKAQLELKEAEKAEDAAKIDQMQRRLVKVDKTHVAESQKLLDLLGIPWIAAPGEAEAQCSILVQKGLVYGTATEDMDALTFGTPKLLRNVTVSESRKLPVLEFDLNKILVSLDVTMDQFIDICILCGCDYIPSIRGIGPVKALNFVKKYGNIETIVKNIENGKISGNYTVPDGFYYEKARTLFKEPDINRNGEELDMKIKWKDCDEEGLIDFLVKEKGFSLERVQSAIKRLTKCKGKANQRRMDSFFSQTGTRTSTTKINKMKETAKNKNKNNKSKKNGKKSAKKTGKFLSGQSKTKSKDEKVGPYANVNYSSIVSKSSNNNSNNNNNSSNDGGAGKSVKKSATKSVKSKKKSGKSTKKKSKKTTKSKRKSTTKKKKSTKKSGKSKLIGKKRKTMDNTTDENENENNNGDKNGDSGTPMKGKNILKSLNKSKNDSNNNENDSESEELAGFNDTVDNVDSLVLSDNDTNNNNNDNGGSKDTSKDDENKEFEVSMNEPPKKKARLMKSSEINFGDLSLDTTQPGTQDTTNETNVTDTAITATATDTTDVTMDATNNNSNSVSNEVSEEKPESKDSTETMDTTGDATNTADTTDTAMVDKVDTADTVDTVPSAAPTTDTSEGKNEEMSNNMNEVYGMSDASNKTNDKLNEMDATATEVKESETEVNSTEMSDANSEKSEEIMKSTNDTSECEKTNDINSKMVDNDSDTVMNEKVDLNKENNGENTNIMVENV